MKRMLSLLLSAILIISSLPLQADCIYAQVADYNAEQKNSSTVAADCEIEVADSIEDMADFINDDETDYEYCISDNTDDTLNDIYQSKRIVCYDNDIKSTYGAVSGMCFDDEFTVLKYNTVEDTINAKSRFDNDNIEVSLDITVSADYNSDDMITEYGKKQIETERYINSNIEISTAQDVIVAVIDTGVDYNHEFLKDRMVSGINILDETKTAMDDNFHGTHVAGIIVNNTPSNVKIMPIKVLNKSGNGSLTTTALGIRYAAEHGAKIINMSLGGRIFNKGDTKIIDEAIDYAISKGCVCVVAAGNEQDVTDNYSPANNEKAITVAAVDSLDNHCTFSNYGKSVDVSAPGFKIISTMPKNKYASLSGTSMATPFVSAAAAMFISEDSSLTPDDVEKKLKEAAIDLGYKGYDYVYGAGRIDFGYYLGDRISATSIKCDEDTIKFSYSDYLGAPPYLLSATVLPADATDKSYSYECTDAGIVDLLNGLVYPVQPGEASIHFTLENGNYVKIDVFVNDSKSWLDAAADNYEGGSGTMDDPYLIKTAEQLAKISRDYYECKLPLHIFFEQIADIDLAGRQWYPILARDEQRYISYCNYDGGGYSISNLSYTQEENGVELQDIGLFQKNSGQMENINLKKVNINSNSGVTGAIAARSDGIVSNCTVSGTIQGSMIGGIVGVLEPLSFNNHNSIISNCYVDAKICGSSIGGITSSTGSATIANCIFMGSLIPKSADSNYGGISRCISNESDYQNDTKIVNCISNKNIFYSKETAKANNDSRYEEFSGTQLRAYIKNCYCYENTFKYDKSPEDTEISQINETFLSDINNFTDTSLWDNEYAWDLENNWEINENGATHKKQSKRIRTGDFYYGDLINSIAIFGYYGTSSKITIPSTIEGKPVRYICGGSTVEATTGFYSPNAVVRSVTFPATVEVIGMAAFYQDQEIESVIFNEGLKSIAKYAFYDCPFLLSVTLPKSLNHLGHYAFCCNRYLKNLYFRGSGDCVDEAKNLGKYDITQVRYLPANADSFNKEQWDNGKLSPYNPDTILEISFRNYIQQYYLPNAQSPCQVSLIYGDSVKLKPIIYNTKAKNTNIIWSSSNKKIAVSKDGVVKLTDEAGTTITAKAADGSCTAQIEIVHKGYHPYTIIYNGNSATSGAMPKQKVQMLDIITLSANKYTKTGYTFSGWATSPKGSVVYRNKEQVYILDESKLGKNVNLYAKWKANTYKVKFDKNSGTGSMSTQSFQYNSSKALSKCKFKAPRGKVFVGWAKSKNGTPVYTNGQSVKNLTSQNGKVITLYAKYVTPKKYKISYVMNGGKQPSKYPKTFKSGTGCTLPKPTRKGYTFVGWYKNSKFTGEKITKIKPWITGNQKYYAKWVKNK